MVPGVIRSEARPATKSGLNQNLSKAQGPFSLSFLVYERGTKLSLYEGKIQLTLLSQT